jgi:hypothetical protein
VNGHRTDGTKPLTPSFASNPNQVLVKVKIVEV